MDTKHISRYIDIVFCILLLPVMILLLPLDRWLVNDPQFVTLMVVWLYAIYTLHRRFTVPLMFGRRKRIAVAMILFVLSLIVTYLLTKYQMSTPRHDAIRSMVHELSGSNISSGSNHAPNMSPPRGNHLQQQAVWFLYIVVTTFSIVVALLSELNHQMAERQSIEYEKKRAELSLYKAQINPHFLFNTLNTILGLVVTKSDKAEDAIVQFTSMMRYTCNSSTLDFVSLNTEIEYIKEYIALQRHRISDHTSINLTSSIDSQSNGCLIAPMLLITFVENAVKYGTSSQFPSDIDIDIAVKSGELHLSTKNPIFVGQSNERGAGIGIMNCRKRLELIYPTQYSLHIVEANSDYCADLKIKLK